MAFLARHKDRSGAAHLRAALILVVVAAMLLSVLPGHAAHGIAQGAPAHVAVADNDSGDDGADPALDCAVHPACHAVILPLPADTLVPEASVPPRPHRSTGRPGILAPPLPQPPQFS